MTTGITTGPGTAREPAGATADGSWQVPVLRRAVPGARHGAQAAPLPEATADRPGLVGEARTTPAGSSCCMSSGREPSPAPGHLDPHGRHTEQVATPASPLSQYFDGWYADMIHSPVKDEIEQRHLGLPPGLLSTSLLTWEGIAEVTEALRLWPGGSLLDLACGRGGYGLEIAARTGARLVGVDFSAEAVRQADEQARRLGRTADFRVGDLAATGLGAGSADAALCVDAIQFAPEPDVAYRELRRVLAPGGRVVLTCWEPVDPDDGRLPGRLRRVSLGAGTDGCRLQQRRGARTPRLAGR